MWKYNCRRIKAGGPLNLLCSFDLRSTSHDAASALQAALQGSFDEAFEEWVRVVRLRLELGMILHGHKPWM